MTPPKPPADPFDFGAWRKDMALQSCSLAARGLWFEMLCLMSEGEPRGFLRVGSKAISPKQLARMVAPHDGEDIDALLSELENATVFSRDVLGTIFNRRMARDGKASETKARRSARAGSATPKEVEAEFEALWKVWLKKSNKGYARKKYAQARKAGTLPPIEKLIRIVDFWQNTRDWMKPDPEDPTKTPRAFQPNLGTWLHREGWESQPPVLSSCNAAQEDAPPPRIELDPFTPKESKEWDRLSASLPADLVERVAVLEQSRQENKDGSLHMEFLMLAADSERVVHELEDKYRKALDEAAKSIHPKFHIYLVAAKRRAIA